jgi:hypothetical protein
MEMSGFNPVTISKGAFAFCRYTIAVILWAALIFQIRELVVISFVILLLSYIFKVQKAPLVVLYTHTVDRITPSDKVLVDEKGISFAHLVGTVFSCLCCIFVYFVNSIAGWMLTFLLAVLKTSAACGFCSALKLYGCLTGGNCCRVGRMIRRNNDV